jgi:hypothetical protein
MNLMKVVFPGMWAAVGKSSKDMMHPETIIGWKRQKEDMILTESRESKATSRRCSLERIQAAPEL